MEKIKSFTRRSKTLLVLIFAYLIVFLLTTYFYYQRLSAFGCFDDCNNFMGGYFLLKGKEIFSEFFFNHMPGMAYLSFLVQKLGNPESIYQLIFYHRLSLYLFSFAMGILLIFRFRTAALLTLIIFETTKFYIFGDRFLAESFIVYPLIYMFGLVLFKLNKQKLFAVDYLLLAFFAWLVIFMREPYIPLSIFLFAIILWGRGERKVKIWSGAIFGALLAITLLAINVYEMYLNAFSYNQGITAYEFSKRGGFFISLVKDFFYPVYFFLEGQINSVRLIFGALSAVFILLFAKLLIERKIKLALLIFLILGLSNLRFVVPGAMYYESFHMIVWFGLILFAVFFLVSKLNIKQRILLYLPILIVVFYSFISSDSYLKPVDKTTQFNNGYGNYYSYGEAVRLLSNSNDTLFLEEWDDLIYWVSGLNSSYQYNWYTSLMPFVEKYKTARTQMFATNPPDFYYDACRLLKDKTIKPDAREINRTYQRVLLNGNPSCLLVRNDKLNDISNSRWDNLKPLGFSLR